MDLKSRIKHLNIEIRSYFYSQKQQKIRKQIKPGNTKSLWNAVNASKDIGHSSLLNVMSLDGKVVSGKERSQCFADFFEQKVRNMLNEPFIDGIIPQISNI